MGVIRNQRSKIENTSVQDLIDDVNSSQLGEVHLTMCFRAAAAGGACFISQVFIPP